VVSTGRMVMVTEWLVTIPINTLIMTWIAEKEPIFTIRITIMSSESFDSSFKRIKPYDKAVNISLTSINNENWSSGFFIILGGSLDDLSFRKGSSVARTPSKPNIAPGAVL
jgi:hypothetical protein